jgi:two-component system response regulator ChvI
MTDAFDQVAMALDAEASVLSASVNEPDAIRVLLIKDGAIDRGFLTHELSKQGFAVQTVASLAGAPDAVGGADVIVLCGRADYSSIDLLGKLHRLGLNVPVVLLTDQASPAHECLALDKGASDVMCKTRGMAKPGPVVTQTQTMICGKLLLRPDVGRAYWRDTDLGLTLGEYNIIYLLASNVGRYVTYRAIYDRLHYEGFIAGDGADGYRANVRSAIKRIRNKFRSLDPTFDEIKNYNGFGYCWKKPD